MESPKKLNQLHKQNSFIIRRTLRPPSGLRPSRMSISPQKSRDSRKRMMENYWTSRATAPTTMGLTTSCWCLYDENKQREWGFRQHYQREVASLTKIMTTLRAIELMSQLGLKSTLLVKITQNAAKLNGTSANLKAGSWIALNDLFYGAMLPSGNDAAHALAEVIGFFCTAAAHPPAIQVIPTIESIDLTGENTQNYVTQFLRQMNNKAASLGLLQTRFSNPHGLQNAMNISSARDMVMLSRHAASNSLFRKVMNTQYKRYQYYTDHFKSEKEVKVWYNTNALLKKGWQGVKTGQTPSAGCCLSSVRDGVYIVVLNCSDIEKRFSQTEKLFTWYWDMLKEEPQKDSPI